MAGFMQVKVSSRPANRRVSVSAESTKRTISAAQVPGTAGQSHGLSIICAEGLLAGSCGTVQVNDHC